MRIVTGAEVRSARRARRAIGLELATGESVEGERLLVATGRRADLAALGVGSVGLDEKARSIPVDDMCRAAPGLWAIGDVTGVGAFTHVSMYQAEIAAADILGRPIASARLPGAAPGDLHRPRDRLGRTERGRGASRRAERADRATPISPPRRGAGSKRSTTPGSSSSSRTRTAACSSGRPRPGPAGARCSRCSRSPSTPRSRSHSSPP